MLTKYKMMSKYTLNAINEIIRHLLNIQLYYCTAAIMTDIFPRIEHSIKRY